MPYTENVRESHKFIIPEREDRIPENHISGILNSQKFSIPELQDSRSKKIRKWPHPTSYGTAREWRVRACAAVHWAQITDDFWTELL